MSQNDFLGLKKGFSKLKENPQLWWTVIVAFIIFIAFVFTANLFIKIAQDAQDRLINVRVGSIHDTLSQYVDSVDTQKELNEIVKNIAESNNTIKEFRIIYLNQLGAEIIASLDESEINSQIENVDQLANFAIIDSDNSYTTKINSEDERFYVTTRSFKNSIGETVGYIETVQTLSHADTLINQNIRNSVLIFVIILFVVMLLFLRHAKIIDYVSLYKKLKEVDNLKDEFISMASHELKSPLAIIRGYAEFLRDARELSEQNKEYARRIDISTKQLTKLVEDMLDVSRIEQERVKFDFERFEIVKFLKEQFENFQLQAKDKGLKLSFETGGFDSQEIKLDKDKLRQIYINILSNAVKYTNEGSVVSKISITKDKNIEIRISDTGIGMTQKQVEKLFSKFYRVKTKETEEVSGTGLGLWITKQLVEKMGGEISVESIKGKGTDFVVNFPVK